MDLTLSRDALRDALSLAVAVLPSRTPNPVLRQVLLQVNSTNLRVTATDSVVALTTDLDIQRERGGALAVDGRDLLQAVKALPAGDVHLEVVKSNRLAVSVGRARYELPGLDADEYPALPHHQASATLTIRSTVLARLVACTAFAVSPQEERYGLNGAHVERVEGDDGQQRLRLVATDGHRLARAQGPFDGEFVMPARMLVPQSSMAVLAKFLEADTDPEGTVEVSFGEGSVELMQAHRMLWLRLVDGQFPDYRAVWPTATIGSARLPAAELAGAMRRVGVIVQRVDRATRFAFRGHEVEVDVHSIDRGKFLEQLPAELQGDAITIGFNSRYVADCLGVLDGDQVELKFSGELNACEVTDPADPDVAFVLMPMRID